MRCPACDVENAEGATVCTSCGKDMTQAAAAPSAAPPAAATGRRFSKLAIFSLIAAGIAPSMQVLRDDAGGRYLSFVGKSPFGLLGLDVGATALLALAVIASIVALVQVLRRNDLRGGALAVGGLVLAIGGLAASTYADMLPPRLGELVASLGGGSSTYVWRTTVIILGAAILCELVLILLGGQPVAEEPPAETAPAEQPAAADK